MSLAERAHHYFSATKNDYSIRSWQKRFIKYLEEQKRLPFPLFRLAETWQEFFLGRQSISFQSARGEDFQLPLNLTEDLAYLTGVIMGDGHLAEYFINIIDSSKQHIENLSKLFGELFASRIEFFKQSNANAWNVNILGKWIVRYFNFLSGQPIAQRKYPALREPKLFSFIYNKTSLQLRNVFWRGLMDADGSYKNGITFGTASKRLLDDFILFLSQHSIEYKVYEQEHNAHKSFVLSILGKSRKDFTDLVGTSHPQKQEDTKTILDRKINRYSPRPQTLIKQGTWKGKIVSFRKDGLLEGFFDFSRLQKFCVLNNGNLLKELRGNHTQKNFTEKIPINQGMLSQYERNEIAIPLSILEQIFTQANTSIKEFYKNNPKLSFRVRKSKCTLDTQPNDYLLELLQGIQTKEMSYFLFIGTENKPLEEYKEVFCAYFLISKPEKRFFRNAVLYSFVREFCNLK